jgi:DNA transformation protein
MLLSAGIRSEQQLRDMGAVAAYLAVKATGHTPSLNLLWAIEGALTDRDWRAVSRDQRTSLLMQLDALGTREKVNQKSLKIFSPPCIHSAQACVLKAERNVAFHFFRNS